jgi:cyclophilin family peptidyl-prolyl cis-trans isomerase
MRLLLSLLLLSATVFAAEPAPTPPKHPYVEMITTEGRILIELDGQAAPYTVDHFLSLVDAGFYDGTIFHRVIPDFMIQGGGYTPSLTLKEDETGIPNESGNGLSNVRGTLAMARTNAPHSANSQFFINLVDNSRLDPQDGRWGYTVFGIVIEGMDVVDAIAAVPTGPQGKLSSDVPQVPVIIKELKRFSWN